MQRYFIKITETVRCSAKVTSCAGSNPIKTICKYRFHYVRFGDNLSHLWNRLWEIKICLLHRDQSKRHIYLFLLSAQGHCFHGDSVMASFASLSFFSLHSLHICNISVWRPLMTVVALAPASPPTVLHFSSLPPSSLSRPLWKTKWKIKV